MKAINIQRRRLMTSLALSALAAAPGAAWAQTAAKALASARGARIVVVGAGVGGATAAKYLKLFNKNLDVTLIDRNPNFIRHYGSSELITGAVTMEDLTVSYDALFFRIMDGKIGRTNTRARYQYLKAQPAEQALAAQYLHSWMNTITADSFG